MFREKGIFSFSIFIGILMEGTPEKFASNRRFSLQ
jgi:hypothetical protein